MISTPSCARAQSIYYLQTICFSTHQLDSPVGPAVSSVEGGGHPCTIVKEGMAVEKLLRWETLVVTHCSQQRWGTVKIEGFQIAISFHIASPMAGNVTVAIPKQTLSAGSKGQPPPTQPLPLDISLWPQRPRLAHPSPELLKRVCPEWEMHFSKLEGYSEGGTLG